MANRIAPDCCQPPLRGTMDGVAEHRRRHSQLCIPCRRARDAYIEWVTAKFDDPDAQFVFSLRTVALVQDYLFLIRTGETHAETIARRLGYRTVAAVEGRLRHAGLKLLHEHPLRRKCAA